MQELIEYIKEQKKNPETFVRLPSDKKNLARVKSAVKKYSALKPEIIVVVGIGGSNLGTLAIWRALKGQSAFVKTSAAKQEIGFAETLDARRLDRMMKHIERKNRGPAVIIIVSKSGTTTETVANAAALLGKLKKNDEIAAITDENSKLWDLAKERNWEILTTPKEISGRYSVFSAVGLFPLALAGIKIEKLLEGASAATDECLRTEIGKNPAARSATEIYGNWKKGKIIHDTFIFEPDLEYVGRWYRQLTGESLGKNGKGITPTVSVGTTDLHSVGQLYLGGPKDKFTTFISVKDHGVDFTVSPKSGMDKLVPDISGKKFSEILATTLEGVKAVYKKQNLPFAEIEIPQISEYHLGYLLQTKMMEIMYLGKLMGVNPFDQPQVELYKEETRKLLRSL